jgi:DNA-binding response OmpR family regulator
VSPSLPIVAVSRHDYEERALEMREAGADDYGRRARMPDDLPQLLAELLDRRSS